MPASCWLTQTPGVLVLPQEVFQEVRRQNPKRGKSKGASRQARMAPDVEEGVHLLLGLAGTRPD